MAPYLFDIINHNLLLGQLVANRNFDINCRYRIYYGTWNDGGELWFDSYNHKDELLEIWLNYHVKYITLDTSENCIVIEIG